eukprot:2856775-Pyramimonas_sp.AAC.1
MKRLLGKKGTKFRVRVWLKDAIFNRFRDAYVLLSLYSSRIESLVALLMPKVQTIRTEVPNLDT